MMGKRTGSSPLRRELTTAATTTGHRKRTAKPGRGANRRLENRGACPWVSSSGLPPRHCCIEAKRALAGHQCGEAGTSAAMENHNKPGIRGPVAWLLDWQVD